MLLAIANNPYAKDPKLLWEMLEENDVENDMPAYAKNEKLDIDALEQMKELLSGDKSIKIK